MQCYTSPRSLTSFTTCSCMTSALAQARSLLLLLQANLTVNTTLSSTHTFDNLTPAYSSQQPAPITGMTKCFPSTSDSTSSNLLQCRRWAQRTASCQTRASRQHQTFRQQKASRLHQTSRKYLASRPPKPRARYQTATISTSTSSASL